MLPPLPPDVQLCSSQTFRHLLFIYIALNLTFIAVSFKIPEKPNQNSTVMSSSDCNILKTCDLQAEKKCKTNLSLFATQIIKFAYEIKAFLEFEKTKINKMWQLSVKTHLLQS